MNSSFANMNWKSGKKISVFPTTEDRESSEKKGPKVSLNPWNITSIVSEICKNFMLQNTGQSLGFAFEQTYSEIEAKSTIACHVSYDWKTSAPQKTPAVFVTRDDARLINQTIGQGIGSNDDREGILNRHYHVSIPISLIAIAPEIGFAEQFAEYVSFPFLHFSQEIQNEYNLAKFRLVSISKPQLMVAPYAKDTFAVQINLDIEYPHTWSVKIDSLKLKTMHASIFNSCNNTLLDKQ